ncbi:MAG TPA: helix-turn-helix transcriptional regulator [Stellaceae bacterium]|nr:helix-turn-helix transcriptional regulator [Stellaceae bacterium]
MSHRSTDAADYQDVPCPIAAMAKDFPNGSRVPQHRHARAQLVFAAHGVMVVSTGQGSWVVPPQRAVWMPPETEHAIRTWGQVAMRTLYVRADLAASLPAKCCVIAVSALLRELVLRAVELPLLYDEAGAAGRVMALILDEIRALPVLPLHLPWPADARLKRLCAAIQHDPASARTLDEWGRGVGASGRTLARLFRQETGMSFGAWRQQVRLVDALGRLAAGQPVTDVALDLGYQSPSAFTSMFRRALGHAPTRYFMES